MAWLPLALTVVSTAVAAFGAIQQGRAAKAAHNYNAQVAEQNAQIAQQQASAAAMQSEREKTLRLGAIRAAAGASGVSMEGSALDVLGDVAMQSELEKQNVLYQGDLKARGFQNDASLERFQGTQAARAGVLKAGGALLSGGSQAYGQWNAMPKREG